MAAAAAQCSRDRCLMLCIFLHVFHFYPNETLKRKEKGVKGNNLLFPCVCCDLVVGNDTLVESSRYRMLGVEVCIH